MILKNLVPIVGNCFHHAGDDKMDDLQLNETEFPICWRIDHSHLDFDQFTRSRLIQKISVTIHWVRYDSDCTAGEAVIEFNVCKHRGAPTGGKGCWGTRPRVI